MLFSHIWISGFLFFSDCNLLQSIFIKASGPGFIATLFPNLVLFLCWKASRSLQRAFLLCQVTLAWFPRFTALLYSRVPKSAVLYSWVPTRHCPGLLYSTHMCPSLLCSQFHNAPGLLYSTHGAQVCCDLLAVASSFSNSILLMIPEVCTTRIPKDVHVSSLFCS